MTKGKLLLSLGVTAVTDLDANLDEVLTLILWGHDEALADALAVALGALGELDPVFGVHAASEHAAGVLCCGAGADLHGFFLSSVLDGSSCPVHCTAYYSTEYRTMYENFGNFWNKVAIRRNAIYLL